MKTSVTLALQVALAATMAAILGGLVKHVLWIPWNALYKLVYNELTLWGLQPTSRFFVPLLQLVTTLAWPLSSLIALGIYSLMRFRRHRPDGNTYCGVCGYILKGLSEPRCPECGTRI